MTKIPGYENLYKLFGRGLSVILISMFFVTVANAQMIEQDATHKQSAVLDQSAMAEQIESVDDDGFEFGAEGSIVSSYIWRGQAYTGRDDDHYFGVSVQPCVWASYKGFSFSVWSSLGFTKHDMAEVDLELRYDNNGFYAFVTDYWCTGYGAGIKYFDYKNYSTGHTFEATVGYDFGFMDVNWSTNFAGYDGVTPKGKRAYSSYFEATVPFSLLTLDWVANVGLTPWATDYYYNATSFAVCEIGLQAAKEIKISESFGFSIFAKYCLNPSTMKSYVVGGISF